jgi:hypothetical protein
MRRSCCLPQITCSPCCRPCWCSIQVNCLLPGAINTPFLDSVLNSKAKMDYLLHRIPAGGCTVTCCIAVGGYRHACLVGSGCCREWERVVCVLRCITAGVLL